MMTYEALRQMACEYDNRTATQCIIVINKTKSERTRQQYKMILFEMSKDIIVANIENFFAMLNNHGYNQEYGEFMTRDDMVGEAYVVFEKSVKNFMKVGEYNYGKKFIPDDAELDIQNWRKYNWGMYFNKSLTRTFYRQLNKYFAKHSDISNYENYTVLENIIQSRQVHDFIDHDLNNLGYTDVEIRIIKSRMAEQRLDDFLEENPDVARSNYFKILTQIKEKTYGYITHHVAFNRGL